MFFLFDFGIYRERERERLLGVGFFFFFLKKNTMCSPLRFYPQTLNSNLNIPITLDFNFILHHSIHQLHSLIYIKIIIQIQIAKYTITHPNAFDDKNNTNTTKTHVNNNGQNLARDLQAVLVGGRVRDVEVNPAAVVEVYYDGKPPRDGGRLFGWPVDTDPCFRLDVESDILGDHRVPRSGIRICIGRGEFKGASDRAIRVKDKVRVCVRVEF